MHCNSAHEIWSQMLRELCQWMQHLRKSFKSWLIRRDFYHGVNHRSGLGCTDSMGPLTQEGWRSFPNEFYYRMIRISLSQLLPSRGSQKKGNWSPTAGLAMNWVGLTWVGILSYICNSCSSRTSCIVIFLRSFRHLQRKENLSWTFGSADQSWWQKKKPLQERQNLFTVAKYFLLKLWLRRAALEHNCNKWNRAKQTSRWIYIINWIFFLSLISIPPTFCIWKSITWFQFPQSLHLSLALALFISTIHFTKTIQRIK